MMPKHSFGTIHKKHEAEYQSAIFPFITRRSGAKEIKVAIWKEKVLLGGGRAALLATVYFWPSIFPEGDSSKALSDFDPFFFESPIRIIRSHATSATSRRSHQK
jgi:hypothetical protein